MERSRSGPLYGKAPLYGRLSARERRRRSRDVGPGSGLGRLLSFFQYLGEIPAIASGSNAVSFRFADRASPAPVPILPRGTIPLLATLLLMAGLASLLVPSRPHRKPRTV